MCDGKETVEVRGRGDGATNIMEFWTMEGYTVVFLIGVAVVAVTIILGVEEGAGSVLSGGYFENYSDVNLEGVGTGEGDTLGVL